MVFNKRAILLVRGFLLCYLLVALVSLVISGFLALYLDFSLVEFSLVVSAVLLAGLCHLPLLKLYLKPFCFKDFGNWMAGFYRAQFVKFLSSVLIFGFLFSFVPLFSNPDLTLGFFSIFFVCYFVPSLLLNLSDGFLTRVRRDAKYPWVFSKLSQSRRVFYGC